MLDFHVEECDGEVSVAIGSLYARLTPERAQLAAFRLAIACRSCELFDTPWPLLDDFGLPPAGRISPPLGHLLAGQLFVCAAEIDRISSPRVSIAEPPERLAAV